MPDKTPPKKKKSAKPAAKANSKVSRPKAAPKKSIAAFFVHTHHDGPWVSDQKPADNPAARRFSDFAAAKAAAIDALVDSIERAEKQLAALSAAQSLDEWQSATTRG